MFARISPGKLAAAVDKIENLACPEEDYAYAYYEQLGTRYGSVRRFLPLLLKTIDFQSTEAARPVLEAWTYLGQMEESNREKLERGSRPGRPDMHLAPRSVVSRPWKRFVFRTRGGRQIDKRFYTLCTLERLQDALRRRAVFVSPSEQWGDPRAKLLQGQAWQSMRAQVCRSLDHSPDPEPELQMLAQQLDEAYQRTAENLPTNASVRIEQVNGRAAPVITGLDKLEEPQSLKLLKEQVASLMPRVDLAERGLHCVNQWSPLSALGCTHRCKRPGGIANTGPLYMIKKNQLSHNVELCIASAQTCSVLSVHFGSDDTHGPKLTTSTRGWKAACPQMHEHAYPGTVPPTF